MSKNSGDRSLFSKIATLALCSLLFLAAPSIASAQQGERWSEQMFRLQQTVQLLTAPGTDIGVTARDLTASDIRQPSLTGGAVVDDVRKDSPASRAGIRKGDIVVTFDGEMISSGRQFALAVQHTVPGTTVKTMIVRDGVLRELSITVPFD